MSAVQDAMRQRQEEARGGLAWPRRCPLFDETFTLVGYVLSVLACYLTLIGVEAASAPVTAGDVTLFAGLMCCGALCVEATRRLGQPSGVWRDLLSAWWLPVALLLPPFYALIAPAVLGLLIYVRVRRGPIYRRIFSTRGARPGRRVHVGPVPLARPGHGCRARRPAGSPTRGRTPG